LTVIESGSHEDQNMGERYRERGEIEVQAAPNAEVRGKISIFATENLKSREKERGRRRAHGKLQSTPS